MRSGTPLLLFIGVAGLAAGVLSPSATRNGSARSPATVTIVRSTPTPLWGGFLLQTPAPLAASLPLPEPRPIDGIFARDDPSLPQWWSCRRCADYRSTGGIWRLQFDRGIVRLVHDVTQWRTLASYVADEERLTVFNDPVCPSEAGTYAWRRTPEGLVLSVVDDPCAFGLRAENLTRQPWSDCQPPDVRAAVSDAWSTPAACEPETEIPPSAEISAGLQVGVFPGDVRRHSPPAQIIVANSENVSPPAGMTIDAAEEIIRYGLNLILWREGDWIEWTLESPGGAVGVQFWGSSRMGAARVLMDGEEAWRGVAADLGEYLGQYGGYVEVQGVSPGIHRLRVEHLHLDARPVTVLFFGLG